MPLLFLMALILYDLCCVSADGSDPAIIRVQIFNADYPGCRVNNLYLLERRGSLLFPINAGHRGDFLALRCDINTSITIKHTVLSRAAQAPARFIATVGYASGAGKLTDWGINKFDGDSPSHDCADIGLKCSSDALCNWKFSFAIMAYYGF